MCSIVSLKTCVTVTVHCKVNGQRFHLAPLLFHTVHRSIWTSSCFLWNPRIYPSLSSPGTAHDRVNKYALVFGGESKEELEASKRKSREPLKPFNEELLTSHIEMFTIPDSELGMPRRGRYVEPIRGLYF